MPPFVGFQAFEEHQPVESGSARKTHGITGDLGRALKMCGKRDPTTRVRGLQALAHLEKHDDISIWWEANIERICTDPEWRVRSAAVEALESTEPRLLRGQEKVTAELWLLSYDPELKARHLWTKVYPKPIAIEKHASLIADTAVQRLQIKERRLATLAAAEGLCLASDSEAVEAAISHILANPSTWFALRELKRQREWSSERRMCQRLLRAAGSGAIKKARELNASVLSQTLVSQLLAEADPGNAQTMWDSVLLLGCSETKLMAAAVKRGPRFAAAAIDRDLPSQNESWSVLHDAFLDAVPTLTSSAKAKILLERLYQVSTLDEPILARLWLAYVAKIGALPPSDKSNVPAATIVALAAEQDMLLAAASSESEDILKVIAESDFISLEQRVEALSKSQSFTLRDLHTLADWFLACDSPEAKIKVIVLCKRSLTSIELIAFLDILIPKINIASLPALSELVGAVDATQSIAWRELESRWMTTDPLAIAASGLASDELLNRVCQGDPWHAIKVLSPLFKVRADIEHLCFRCAALAIGLAFSDEQPLFSSEVNSAHSLVFPAEALTTFLENDDAWAMAATWAVKSALALRRPLEPHPWACASSSDQKNTLLDVASKESISVLEALLLDGADDSSRLVEAALLHSDVPELWLQAPRTEKRVVAAQAALQSSSSRTQHWIKALFPDTPVYPPVINRVHTFSPGDSVLYDGARVCQVLSVEVHDEEHFYHVRFLNDNHEKDTVAERLSPLQSEALLPEEERLEPVAYCEDDEDGGEKRRYLFAREMWLSKTVLSAPAIRDFAFRGLSLNERIDCCIDTTDLKELAAWYDTIAVVQPLPLSIRKQAIALLDERVDDLEWLSTASLRGAFSPITTSRASRIVDAAAGCILKASANGAKGLVSVVALAARTDSGAARRFLDAVLSTLVYEDKILVGLEVVAALTTLNFPLAVSAESRKQIAQVVFDENTSLSFDQFFAGLDLLLKAPEGFSYTSVEAELARLRQSGYPSRQRGTSRMRPLAALLLSIEAGRPELDELDSKDADQNDHRAIISNGLVACLDSWRDGGDVAARFSVQKGNARRRGIDVSQYNTSVSTYINAHGIDTNSGAEALLAALVAYRCFILEPSLSREWAAAANAKDASAARRLSEEVLCSAAVDRELEAVSMQASSIQKNASEEDSSLAINVSKVSKQVVAIYTRDECVIEMIIKYSTAHPLRSVVVDFGAHQGIQDTTARRWALQLRACANHQNTINAIHRWRASLDLEFNHVEPCPICYGVLHPKSKRLPHVQCSTCNNKFHGSCLAHWFQTSHKHLCPVCQSEFVAAKSSSSKGKEAAAFTSDKSLETSGLSAAADPVPAERIDNATEEELD